MCIETVPSTLNLTKTQRLLIIQTCVMNVGETIIHRLCLHATELKMFDLSTIPSILMEAT